MKQLSIDLAASKALVLRICQEGVNQRQWNVIDEVFRKDAVLHGAGGDTTVQAYRDGWLSMVAAMPDLKINTIVTIAEQDRVADVWYLKGTYTHPLPTPQGELKPTGKTVLFNGIRVGRIEAGKIVESWDTFDTLLSAQQLGYVPAQAELPVVHPWKVKLGTSPYARSDFEFLIKQEAGLWNTGKTTRAQDCFAPDLSFYFPSSLNPQPLNFDGVIQQIAGSRAAFEGLTINTELTIMEGDLAVSLYTWEGTYVKEMANIPANGAKVKVNGINLFRFKGQKIVEMWDNWNTLNLMQQMMAPKSKA